MDIRNKLLATHLFLENEYFEKYIQLINSNSQTKRQIFKTQKHHIIPVIAFKLYNWSGIDSKDNLVNLLYKDHILAHYYLALCSKENSFKYKMVSAINFILGKAVQVKLNVEDLKIFTLNLDYYQQLYEELKIYNGLQLKGTTHQTSEETKLKISKANSRRVYVNKENIVRSITLDELPLYLENGWIKGNPNCQKRDLKKGYTIVNKENVEKYIKEEELQSYLINGWNKGRSYEHKQATKLGTQKYMNSLSKEERKRFGHKCVYKGQKRPNGDRISKIVSEKLKGRKRTQEQKLKNSINKKGTIHMTNGIKNIMIKKEREQEFIILGYHKGRTINRKEGK